MSSYCQISYMFSHESCEIENSIAHLQGKEIVEKDSSSESERENKRETEWERKREKDEKRLRLRQKIPERRY